MPKSQTNPAEWTYELVANQINDFEASLSADEEIGARLVGVPGAEVMHVEDVGYAGPHMIFFYGTNEHDKPMQLMQHYTQLSLLLTALPKKQDEARRIGFHLVQKIDD